MAETSTDWTAWVITTIGAAFSTMVGTVVFLAKLIESRYVTEITELKQEVKGLSEKHEECTQGHHLAELRLARLEEQIKTKAEFKQ